MPLMDYNVASEYLAQQATAKLDAGVAEAKDTIKRLEAALEEKQQELDYALDVSRAEVEEVHANYREAMGELELVAERACHCPTAPESFDYCVVCMARMMLDSMPNPRDL